MTIKEIKKAIKIEDNEYWEANGKEIARDLIHLMKWQLFGVLIGSLIGSIISQLIILLLLK